MEWQASAERKASCSGARRSCWPHNGEVLSLWSESPKYKLAASLCLRASGSFAERKLNPRSSPRKIGTHLATDLSFPSSSDPGPELLLPLLLLSMAARSFGSRSAF
jgi:hypothetical protein